MPQKVFLYASLREGYKKFAHFTYIDRHQTCTEDINAMSGTACAIAVQFGHFAAESIHVTLKKNL